MRPIPVKEIDELRKNQDFYLSMKAFDPEVGAESKLTLGELLEFWQGELKTLKFKYPDETFYHKPDDLLGRVPASHNTYTEFFRIVSREELAKVQRVIKKYSVRELEGN